MRPIRKFERIIVLHRFGLINLSEDCRRVSQCFHPPIYDEAEICNRYRAGKRKLGSWKNANRHISIFRCSEPACASTEVSCGEFVANLRRPRPDSLKAVVTHRWNPLLEKPLQPHQTLAHLRSSPHHENLAPRHWRFDPSQSTVLASDSIHAHMISSAEQDTFP